CFVLFGDVRTIKIKPRIIDFLYILKIAKGDVLTLETRTASRGNQLAGCFWASATPGPAASRKDQRPEGSAVGCQAGRVRCWYWQAFQMKGRAPVCALIVFGCYRFFHHCNSLLSGMCANASAASLNYKM
ncbi:MAG: hypothetical protein VW987_10530, partial [Alphaproteobacteria bacterium]